MGNVMTTCSEENLGFLPDLIGKVKAGRRTQRQEGLAPLSSQCLQPAKRFMMQRWVWGLTSGLQLVLFSYAKALKSGGS